MTFKCTFKNKDYCYRNYGSVKRAIDRFKKIAIERYTEVADIAVLIDKKWNRIRWK